MRFGPSSSLQAIVLAIWALATMYLINRGGRNNGIFRIVVQSGFRLILIGAVTAAIIGTTASDPSNKIFTDSAVQFILVLSAGIGGNYIAHANMALRDFPKKLDGPEMLPGVEAKKSEAPQPREPLAVTRKNKRQN